MAGMEQIFGKYPNLFMDLKEYYENFCTFEHVKDSPHLFDNILHYDAGKVLENGKIVSYQNGASNTFFVGLPVYDLQNNKIGYLSYVFTGVEDGWYRWQILGYKGLIQDIKTYWQVLKEGKIKELE